MNTGDRYPVSVLVRSADQLQRPEIFEHIDRAYISWHAASDWRTLESLKDKGVQLYMALPHIVREDYADRIRGIMDEALGQGYGGFLVRTMEELVFARDRGAGIVADSCLYSFNGMAEEFLKEQGAGITTAPFELNRHELKERGLDDTELIVYTYIPLMVTAQCVKKTAGVCGAGSDAVLTDRYRNTFRTAAVCDCCYNIIFNSRPLYLMDRYEEVDALKPASLRLELFDEDSRETERLFDALKAFSRGEDVPCVTPFTRGHFSRGVE
ncbi:MAG: hypothetical protein IJM62_04305 [Lachnospiraceae bacterium]|nr:hypothetical protein [Lachnospiraceae bacterium]